MRLAPQVAETRMDDSLLNYYKKEWDRITTSMSYISRIFRYLVRLSFALEPGIWLLAFVISRAF